MTAGSAIASNKAQNAAEKANREAAERARIANIKELGFQQTEVAQDAATQLFQTQQAVRSARSLARVGAGESGVAGISAQAVLDDIEREGGDVSRSINRQASRDIAAIQRGKIAQTELTRNRIAQVGRGSPLALGLSIAGAGLNFAQFRIDPPASPDVNE